MAKIFLKPLSKGSASGAGLVPNLLMLFLGLLIALPCAYRIYAYQVFRLRAVAVEGVVDKPSGGSDFGGRPLVAFKDGKGALHVVKSREKTHFFVSPQKGEAVRVLYDETDPGEAMVDSPFHFVYLPLAFFLLGAAVVLRALSGLRGRD